MTIFINYAASLTGTLTWGCVHTAPGYTATTSPVLSGSTFTPALLVNIINATGTSTQSLGGFSTFNIASESAAFNSGIGLCNISAFYNFGAGGGLGTRYGILSNLVQKGASSNSAPNNTYYTSVGGSVNCSFNSGGTATTHNASVGNLSGGNFIATLSSGATNYFAVQGAEVDVAIASGASAWRKQGLFIAQLSSDVVAGTQQDAGLVIGAQPGAIGWSSAIEVGTDSNFGIAASGTILRAATTGTVTYGIDFSNITFSAGGAGFLAPLITPASSSATGKQGSIIWDANFIYVCTSTNTWKRAALATF